MNRKQKNRLFGIAAVLLIVSGALALILYALKQNINLFFTPSQLLQSSIQQEQIIRVGGYVKSHSVAYDPTGTRVDFIITDKTHEISASYHGVLPNLFREGQGVVVTGKINSPDHIEASEVLAKHDEKYMPWPLAQALQSKTGQQK